MLRAAEAALAMFNKGHAIDHFNWKDSALNADNIAELNEVPLALQRAIRASKGAV